MTNVREPRIEDSLFVLAVHDSSMHQTVLKADPDARPLDMPALVELLAQCSARPRYAYMVLDLIAKVAGTNGSAGPLVLHGGSAVPIREWLCDALASG